MSEVQTELKSYNAFWDKPVNSRVFKQITEGKTLEDIRINLKLTQENLAKVIKDPRMLTRIDADLSIKLFDLEIKKLDFRTDAFLRLKEKFEAHLADCTADTVVKEYLKMLTEKTTLKKIDPNQVNIFINAVEKSKERSLKKEEEGLEKEFGYNPLIINPANNGPDTITTPKITGGSTDPTMDKKESNPN